MARAARLYYPGGVFHVVSRCLNRDYLIDGEPERAFYLDLLARVLSRTDHRILAWCLMSNHVHLVVEAGEEPLSRLMKPLHVGYANWKNRREGRIGPVFADRFRSILVEREAHLDELVRYVHLNPVRAGVVRRPEDSTWSSHRVLLGLEPCPAWLHADAVFERFSRDPVTARQRYASFVLEGLGQPRVPTFSGEGHADVAGAARRVIGDANRVSHPILGSEAFVEDVLKRQQRPVRLCGVASGDATARPRPTPDDLIAVICTVLELDLPTFRLRAKTKRATAARQMLVWLWTREFGAPQSDLCRILHCTSAQVSRWYGRAIDRFDELEPWLEKVSRLLPAIADRREPGSTAPGPVTPARPRRATYGIDVTEE